MTQPTDSPVHSDAAFPPPYIAFPPPTPVRPCYTADGVTLYQGDCLRVLPTLPGGTFDAIVTDPPYCSGGLSNAERIKSTTRKYVLKNSGTSETILSRPEFTGDSRDQRSFMRWVRCWLLECYRVAKEDAMLAVFTDWRQLPAISDAIQETGWVWRGVFTWDKTDGVRPNMGWFRQQCEYVLLAFKGRGVANKKECFSGVWRGTRREEDRMHVTGKPVPLMQSILAPLPAGAAVLDPFAGGGSTLIAARSLGMTATGIEYTQAYADICARRLRSPGVRTLSL